MENIELLRIVDTEANVIAKLKWDSATNTGQLGYATDTKRYVQRTGLNDYAYITANNGNPTFDGITDTSLSGTDTGAVVCDSTGKFQRATLPSTLFEAGTTGLLSGGQVTVGTGLTVNVAAGSGHIIDSWTDPSSQPIDVDFTWTNQTHTISTPAPFDKAGGRVIYIDEFGVITDVDPFFNASLRRDKIFLAYVEYETPNIIGVNPIPRVANSTGQTLFDWFDFIGYNARIKGLGTQPVTAARSIYQEAGDFFQPSANWFGDRSNPNTLSLPSVGNQTTPLSFKIILADDTILPTLETVIPAVYDDGTSIPATLPTPNATATIYYLYRFLNGVFYIQPSKTTYSDGNTALLARTSDRAALETPASALQLVLVAQIVLEKGSTSFSDPATTGVFSLLGGEGGTSGGGGVTPSLDSVLMVGDDAGNQDIVNLRDIDINRSAAISGSMTVDTDTFFLNPTTGVIGVNTRNPVAGCSMHVSFVGDTQSALVVGDQAVPASTTGIYLRSTTDAYIFSAGNMHFGDVGNKDILFIDGSDKVGILNTSPTTPLDVNGIIRARVTSDQVAAAGGDTATTKDYVNLHGATGSRPITPGTGQRYFDTTLGKPVWYDGTNWVDATGTIS